jgi:hypothetical protein
VGQFVVSLKTDIISGLLYTGLHSANCEGADIELLYCLLVFFKKSHSSPPNPFTSHGRETHHDDLSGCHVAEQVHRELNDVDIDLFSVANVGGFIASDVLHAVRV